MDNTNFWLRNPPIGYAVVNGLMGSTFLWMFWTPFITFLAQPFASAMMKQVLCGAVNAFPSVPILPNSTQSVATKLLDQDPSNLKSINSGSIMSLWLVATLFIVINIWMATSIIRQGMLDINHIIKLNAIMFFVIITLEMIYFVKLGLGFVPFNVQTVFDTVIGNMSQQLQSYQ